MGLKEKLPLLNSSRKLVRLFGYVAYAFAIFILIVIILPSQDVDDSTTEATTTPATTTKPEEVEEEPEVAAEPAVLGVAAGEILEDVEPGSTSVDLGDGYEISFVLDDSFEAYDLIISDPRTTDVGEVYNLGIYEAGNSEWLMDIWINVWPWENLYPKDSMPDKIDGSFGYIKSITFQADFEYLPEGVVTPDGEDIKYTVEVHGQMDDWDSGIEDKLPVFEAVVDSIHVSGPAI